MLENVWLTMIERYGNYVRANPFKESFAVY